MRVRREDIEYFINREFAHTEKKMVSVWLILMIVVCTPMEIFGVSLTITRVFILSINIAFSIWAILVLKKPVDRKKFELFIGSNSCFLSILLLIGAYKVFLSSGQKISLATIFFALGLYLMCIASNIVINILLIKKGHYKQPRKKRIDVYFWNVITAFVCMVSGRTLLGALDQKVEHLGAIFLFVYSLLFVFGTSNILRYYLAIKIKE